MDPAHFVEVNLDITVGMTFLDFDKFQEDLKAKCKSNFLQYFISASRTIRSAKKILKRRHLDTNLKFYSVQWACIHAGKEYRSDGVSLKNENTLSDKCPAHIHMKISRDETQYEVISVNNNHNHLVSEALFKQLPQGRRCAAEIGNGMKLSGMQAKRKKFRKKSNLIHFMNSEVETVCKKIQENFGTKCHILVNGDNQSEGLTFCSKSMVSSLAAYPEFICIDSSYKWPNSKILLYVILNQDGNGESNIVAIAILAEEDRDSLKWFLRIFQNLNPRWKGIQNILCDNNPLLRDLVRIMFPKAQLLVCVESTMKTFQREITCTNFDVTSDIKNAILNEFKNLIFAHNENDFQEVICKIETNFPDRIYEYLVHNWLDTKTEWCPFLGNKVCNFLNCTNNLLESADFKLKSIGEKPFSLDDFANDLFVTMKSLEETKKSSNRCLINKSASKASKYQAKYLDSLTPYAYRKLETQFDLAPIKLAFDSTNQCYSVRENGFEYQTTIESCECYFSKSMGLPCKHIFATRNASKIDLFDLKLVLDRWKMDYFVKNVQFSIEPDVEHETETTNHVLSFEEKYNKTLAKAKLIATLAAELRAADYLDVNNVLDEMIRKLESGNSNFDIANNKNILDHLNQSDFSDEPSTITVYKHSKKIGFSPEILIPVKNEQNEIQFVKVESKDIHQYRMDTDQELNDNQLNK